MCAVVTSAFDDINTTMKSAVRLLLARNLITNTKVQHAHFEQIGSVKTNYPVPFSVMPSLHATPPGDRLRSLSQTTDPIGCDATEFPPHPRATWQEGS